VYKEEVIYKVERNLRNRIFHSRKLFGNAFRLVLLNINYATESQCECRAITMTVGIYFFSHFMARTTWPLETNCYSSATRRVSSSNSELLESNSHHYYHHHHHGDEGLLTNLGIWHETRYICISNERWTSVSITFRVSQVLSTSGMRNNLKKRNTWELQILAAYLQIRVLWALSILTH